MIRFYFDHNVPHAAAQGLRLRGIDVLTALEDRTDRLPDSPLLDRATTLGRMLVSMDVDLVAEAVRRQRESIEFTGVVFARQRLPIGLLVDELELIAGASDADELRGILIYLPLR